MDIMSKFNLPKYLKGKTFAEASKILDNNFKDRSDPESQATMNDLQGRLQQAQEFVKSEQDKLSNPQGAPTNNPSDDLGARANATEQPSAMNQFEEGGFMNMLKGLGGQGDGAKGSMGGMNQYLGAASGIADLGKMAFGRPDIDTSGKTVGPDVDLAGEALGGAMTGFSAGNKILPGVGGAIGAAVGIGAGLIGGNKKRDLADQARFNNAIAIQHKGTNDYRRGGDLDGDDIDFMSSNDTAMRDSGSPYAIPREKVSSISDLIKRVGLQKVGHADGIQKNLPDNTIEPGVASTTKSPGFASNTESPKFNAASLLRYAPSAMNLSQLANMESPDPVGLDRINRKYDQQLVDERGMQNTVQNSVSNNRDAILSSSGGSGSTARANLLASQLQGTKAMSQAYQESGAENRQEGRSAQQFDLGVDQFNVGQGNRSQQINAQNEGAYESNKSKLLAQIGNDLGGIGKEELLKRYPELMGLNYGWQGKKIK